MIYLSHLSSSFVLILYYSNSSSLLSLSLFCRNSVSKRAYRGTYLPIYPSLLGRVNVSSLRYLVP